jgi:hypothetical protein
MIANQIAGLLTGGVPVSLTDYESIETVTVGSGGASSVTFSSIPSTYTHLQIRMLARYTSAGATQFPVRFNSDSGANYSDHALRGNGSAASAGADLSETSMFFDRLPSTSETANVFAGIIIDVLDYANTNKYKTVRTLGGYDNNGSGMIALNSGAWRSTAAVNTIAFNVAVAQYSSFALYGIK